MNQDPNHEIDAIGNTPTPESDEGQTGEMSRRQQMLTAGALGIAALLGTTLASAAGAATQGRRKFGPELFSHTNLTNFANLTIAIWADAELAKRYDTDPRRVLAEYGVEVPKGVPTPLIPQQPAGGIESIDDAWERDDFRCADLLITDVFIASKANYTTNTQSCMSTIGCPLSTCNSFFCYGAA